VEIYTKNGTIVIPLDDVNPCIKEACLYCSDMTAEFSDISVGSARHPEDWEVARSWNQVIVRTQTGLELLKLAESRGRLEFRDAPEGNLEKLKKASMNKKRTATKNLAKKISVLTPSYIPSPMIQYWKHCNDAEHSSQTTRSST
jgi:coenzyme F420 hydrogenase subunit beta